MMQYAISHLQAKLVVFLASVAMGVCVSMVYLLSRERVSSSWLYAVQMGQQESAAMKTKSVCPTSMSYLVHEQCSWMA